MLMALLLYKYSANPQVPQSLASVRVRAKLVAVSSLTTKAPAPLETISALRLGPLKSASMLLTTSNLSPLESRPRAGARGLKQHI